MKNSIILISILGIVLLSCKQVKPINNPSTYTNTTSGLYEQKSEPTYKKITTPSGGVGFGFKCSNPVDCFNTSGLLCDSGYIILLIDGVAPEVADDVGSEINPWAALGCSLSGMSAMGSNSDVASEMALNRQERCFKDASIKAEKESIQKQNQQQMENNTKAADARYVIIECKQSLEDILLEDALDEN
jgi:hypothetical protein